MQKLRNVLRKKLAEAKTARLQLNDEDDESCDIDLDINFDTEQIANFYDTEENEVTFKGKHKRFILRYSSKYRIWWDLFIIILVLFNCI